MSTRIHWLRPIDKRITACGRNSIRADVFAGSAAEYLGISNFCVKCEHAAQKEEALSSVKARGTGKSKLLPAPQWPEPRPIAEAPKDCRILAWETFLGKDLGWIVVSWDDYESQWTDPNGVSCHVTHFLPLPPKPGTLSTPSVSGCSAVRPFDTRSRYWTIPDGMRGDEPLSWRGCQDWQ